MKLINKDALVAEIKKRKKEAEQNCGGYKSYDEHRCDDCRVGFYEEFLEILDTLEVNIFPELAESKGENIRKAIGEFVRDTTGDSLFVNYGVHKEDVLAWLEKQGKQKPYGQREECTSCQMNYAGECKGSCAVKRGEQKPANKAEPKFKVGDKIQYLKGCGTIMTIEKIENGEYIFGNNMGHTTIESGNKWYLVEQKHTDKYKPRFKVGDWITNGDKIEQISEIDNYYRCLNGSHGYGIYVMDIESTDANFHIWTIQDAKDGDIMVYKDNQWIVFFKAFGEEENEVAYYALLSEKGLNFNNYLYSVLTSAFNPATKEQRDLLFQKMKEAGYEWNTEKRKLKKIEHKPAWSEEDESMRIRTIGALSSCLLNEVPKEVTEEINWLKSIRPQKQCGYNPYKETVESIAEMCKKYANDSNLEDFYDNIVVKCKEAKEYDTMFPQKQWKPTKEELEQLQKASEGICTFKPYILRGLLEQLKAL